MKTLSLFLKDGKLFGAFLPEKLIQIKPPFSSGDAGRNETNYNEYVKARSEALSQAMEVVNPDVILDLLHDHDTGTWWRLGFKEFKEGEFYTWEHGYEIPLRHLIPGDIESGTRKVIKLVAVESHREETQDRKPEDMCFLNCNCTEKCEAEESLKKLSEPEIDYTPELVDGIMAMLMQFHSRESIIDNVKNRFKIIRNP